MPCANRIPEKENNFLFLFLLLHFRLVLRRKRKRHNLFGFPPYHTKDILSGDEERIDNAKRIFVGTISPAARKKEPFSIENHPAPA